MKNPDLTRNLQALLGLIAVALGLICRSVGIDGLALILFFAAVLLLISAAIEHICAAAVEQAFDKAKHAERDGG
jgi:heme A synthase